LSRLLNIFFEPCVNNCDHSTKSAQIVLKQIAS
jgi:hypothetical protein